MERVPRTDGAPDPVRDGGPEPVLDGHNDLLLGLVDREDPVAAFRGEADDGPDTHLDLSRARAAGLRASLFAAFVPGDAATSVTETDEGYRYPLPDPIDPGFARRRTREMLARLEELAREVEGFRIARTVEDLEAALAARAPEGERSEPGDPPPLAAVSHLEGAEAIDPDLSNLDDLYAAGLRSVGPVWSRPNAFGHGVRAEYPGDPDTGPGLTDAGRDLVRACEDRGILVDCAHATEAGFFDAADVLAGPLVVSHAGVHAVCPHSRNLTDEMLEVVADSGGLVGITFSSSQLRGDREGEATRGAILDHVGYVADRVGVEHVALGSDLDGASIPGDVGDVTGLPLVVEGLRDRGFDDDAVAKVARENWLRVLRAAWEE